MARAAARRGAGAPPVAGAFEQEQRRLARDIHDGPAQALTNLALRAELIERLIGADDARARAEVRDLRQEALAAAEEIRLLLDHLVPPGLLQADLTEAIGEHLRRLRARYGLVVHCELPPELPADQAAQVTIFRVIQEALQNVLRHSGAEEAWVRAWVTEPATRGASDAPGGAGTGRPAPRRTLVAEIRDAGRGFDPQAAEIRAGRRLGIAGMQERAELAGGTLTVASRLGAGTRITLRLPVDG
jgi:two-component system sensor histidine kinase DegS